MKCGSSNFMFTYRCMFELDTKFGNIHLTAFGKSLENVFGKTAAEFKKFVYDFYFTKLLNFSK